MELEILESEGGIGGRVDLGFSEAPYFTLWSSAPGDFLCVEPCWGLPDHLEQRPFEQKLGVEEIPPLGALRRGFGIRRVGVH